MRALHAVSVVRLCLLHAQHGIVKTHALPTTEASSLATLQEVAEGRTAPWVGKPNPEEAPEDSNVSGATGIDWGGEDDGSTATGAQGGIDWDMHDWAVESVEVGQHAQDDTAAVNWDIVLEDSSGVQEETQQHIEEEPKDNSASVAAVRLAEDGVYRAQLTDDVLELKAFLTMRVAAMQRGGAESLPLGTWFV